MRILFTRFPLESRYGGAEVQTLTLMRGLKALGHDVTFLGSCSVLLEHTARCSLPAARLDIGFPPVTKWLAVSFLWRQFAMRRLLIQALIAHSPQPTAIVMLSLSEKLLLTRWAASRGIRVIWVEHDRVGRWFTHNPWLPRLRRLAKLATTVVVSEMSRDIYRELGWPEENIVAIPNGVEMQVSLPTVRIPIPDSRLHIGCLSRLTHDKGIDVLIDAMDHLPDIRLTIVGTGRDEADFKARAARGGARDRIDFLPSVRAPQDLFDAIDILILPSREHDPFGLVAAEAMFRDIPVIVTDACGIAGYLQSGTDAIVVKAGDRGALQEAISLLSDREHRNAIGTAGQHAAQEKFTAERMSRQYEELLQSL
ncbi:MAG: group 1 glycosyl transferase [Candidatus Peregrinibacteria bacterium Gr01-1014_25]|nr:MAG: group 1 glycosyl transferase [Candidatus Peregrinibacteria bacterium Gr01-1014_25]